MSKLYVVADSHCEREGYFPKAVFADKKLAKRAAKKAGLTVLSVPFFDRDIETKTLYEVVIDLYTDGTQHRGDHGTPVSEFDSTFAHIKPIRHIVSMPTKWQGPDVNWRIIVTGGDLDAINAKVTDLVVEYHTAPQERNEWVQ